MFSDVFLWHGSLLLTPPIQQSSVPSPSLISSTSQLAHLAGPAPEILGLDIRCKSVARQGRHARENPEKPAFFARYIGEMEQIWGEKDEAYKASRPVIPDPLSDAPELSVKITSWSVNPFDITSSPLNSNASPGWVLPFTIPIPTRHFMKMESRQFRLKAVVKVKAQPLARNNGVKGNNEVLEVSESKELEDVELEGLSESRDSNVAEGKEKENLEDDGETIVVSRPIEVTVSHLRRGREMLNFHHPTVRRSGAETPRAGDAAGKKKTDSSRAKVKVTVMEYESGDECSDDEFALT